MNPLALQVLIVASSVSESWLEPSLAKWNQVIDTQNVPDSPAESERPPYQDQSVRTDLRRPASLTPPSKR